MLSQEHIRRQSGFALTLLFIPSLHAPYTVWLE
jgi:hypothetical protein